MLGHSLTFSSTCPFKLRYKHIKHIQLIHDNVIKKKKLICKHEILIVGFWTFKVYVSIKQNINDQ